MKVRTLAALVGAATCIGILGVAEATERENRLRFTEVSGEAGIEFRHEKPIFDPYLERIMAWVSSFGAGVAATDYDGDGDTDLYLLSSNRGSSNALYRNEGDMRFVDVAEASGVARLNDERGVSMDAVFSDTDNDGDQDLFVAAYGDNRFLLNEEGRFRPAPDTAGLSDPGNAAAAIFLDFDSDGWVDLMVGNYFDYYDLWRIPTVQILQSNFENARNGGANLLYRNNRDGTFTQIAERVGLADTGWTLALGSGDLDGDGDPDIYVANDYGWDLLYRNDGGGSFTDTSLAAIGRDTAAGMNVDMADYDGDGLLDIYVTNIYNALLPQGNMLWANRGDMTFENVARKEGVWNGGWGWGAKLADYDNDGDLDIYTVNGFVSDGPVDIFRQAGNLNRGDVSDLRVWPDMRGLSLSGYETSRFFRRDEDQFREAAADVGVDSKLDGRGVAVADFDDDGDLDVLSTVCGGRPLLYRNQIEGDQDWLQVSIEGTVSNRDGIGTRVILHGSNSAQHREIDGGNGYSAQSWRIAHFGLGSGSGPRVLELRWPSGRRLRMLDPPPNKRLIVKERVWR